MKAPPPNHHHQMHTRIHCSFHPGVARSQHLIPGLRSTSSTQDLMAHIHFAGTRCTWPLFLLRRGGFGAHSSRWWTQTLGGCSGTAICPVTSESPPTGACSRCANSPQKPGRTGMVPPPLPSNFINQLGCEGENGMGLPQFLLA